ncbi:hypothetical protein SAMD00019534_064820 [Acytostelium subglobosum LB1]|uniref:hypothetical protein n=1 Tax=Acytostelium subglobosum LB1 TaxID=1410327 RepID=UPI0006450773|nr:hypothetical protein SAMD00019534_064820 [Acytostelium subglobosum LB1]GAM23307.1 hypothetical protein SAMD00019534_064820 [Acytostelium subglobosum LB1]|eukprot:XP_012753756.1 hypothetical protein SAMD00019534_064820 [Acytostelium subglobosum LB1]
MGCCCGKEKKEKTSKSSGKQSSVKVDTTDSTPKSIYNEVDKKNKGDIRERLEDAPNDANALTDYAIILSSEGNDKEALETLRRAIQADQDNSRTWTAYAEYYERKNDSAKAQEIYKEGYKHASPKIALDQDDSDLLLHYAINCKKSGELDRAEKMFKKVVTSGPTNVRGLGLYGEFLLDTRKDVERAGQYLKQAADLEPASAYWCHRYGEFLRDQMKNDAEANLYFKRSVVGVSH